MATSAKKTVPAKKTAAAKKTALGQASGRATRAAALEIAISVGDIVVLMDDNGRVVSDPGRICAAKQFNQFCVAFPVIGCRRAPGDRLQLAPPGSTAPDCGDCDDC